MLTAAVLALLLRRYSLADIFAEVARGDAGPLLLWAGGAALASLIVMGAADWLLIRRALAPLSLGQVIRGKGGSGVLGVVSYGVGQGGYGLWLARTSRRGGRAAVGLIAYIMLLDLTAVCAIASVTLWMGDLELPGSSALLLWSLAPLIALGLMGAALVGPRLLRDRIRDPKLLNPWLAIPARVYALSLALRIVNVGAAMLITWAAARSFGLDIALSVFCTYLPILFLIGSLPIHVAGLGAVQLAWVLVFRPYAAGETILAFQFLFSTLVAIAVVVRGLPFVAGILRDLGSLRGQSLPAAGRGCRWASVGKNRAPRRGAVPGATPRSLPGRGSVHPLRRNRERSGPAAPAAARCGPLRARFEGFPCDRHRAKDGAAAPASTVSGRKRAGRPVSQVTRAASRGEGATTTPL